MLSMSLLRLGILLLHVLRSRQFSGKFVAKSNQGSEVKYHVEGQLINIHRNGHMLSHPSYVYINKQINN